MYTIIVMDGYEDKLCFGKCKLTSIVVQEKPVPYTRCYQVSPSKLYQIEWYQTKIRIRNLITNKVRLYVPRASTILSVAFLPHLPHTLFYVYTKKERLYFPELEERIGIKVKYVDIDEKHLYRKQPSVDNWWRLSWSGKLHFSFEDKYMMIETEFARYTFLIDDSLLWKPLIKITKIT